LFQINILRSPSLFVTSSYFKHSFTLGCGHQHLSYSVTPANFPHISPWCTPHFIHALVSNRNTPYSRVAVVERHTMPMTRLKTDYLVK